MSEDNKNSHYRKSVRKVMKVGECLGVTLPKQYWENHDLKAGDYVEVVYNDVLKLIPLYYHSIMRELGEESKHEEGESRS